MYGYDQFGNVASTTDCASDFQYCTTAGATNPAASGAIDPTDPSDPVHHPQFRTTTVSYDPSALGVPVSYGVGRFPATTTNAIGHKVTTIYDPVLGKVLRKTDPNGIQTCYAYDSFGRQVSETDRCGSSAPLTTTTQYFRTIPVEFCINGPPCPPTGFSPPNSSLVTITTPPTGFPAWAYSDDQGKSTGSLSYAFDGGFVETTNAYNVLGQVTQVAKPFHLATLADQPTPSYTQTLYDSFNRVSSVTNPLGDIDGSGTLQSTVERLSYFGSMMQTDQTVGIGTESRTETKNAIGKVAKVEKILDFSGGYLPMTYAYDADGNLTNTTDFASNQIVSVYDTRGRKIATTDPDMGGWSYTVDGFGDLVSQTDGNNQTVTMIYDALDRMLSKTDSTGTAEWAYDLAPGAGKGQLAAMASAPDPNLAGSCAVSTGISVGGGQRAVKTFSYDQFGQLQQVSECTDGITYSSSYQYDTLGRQSLVRYPVVGNSQLAVGYHYTSLGYLQYLTDESTDYSILWQGKVRNVLGQVTDEQMRNGVETLSTRNPITGWLLNSTATALADGGNVIQNWSYSFDVAGNLLGRTRRDVAGGGPSSETFSYDAANRVRGDVVTPTDGPTRTESYVYDTAGLGNIAQKNGSTYTYGVGCSAGTRTAGPHAVCTVAGGAPFAYDGNGNLTSGGSRSLTYNPSNKVTGIEGGGAGVTFMYGADGNRVVQSVTSGNTTTRTVYVGLGGTGKSLFERTTATGAAAKNVHYIYAGSVHDGNAFALRILEDSGAPAGSQYYSFDHLGSVTAMSDESGRVTTAQSGGTSATVFGYDAWGARRNPDGTLADASSFVLPTGAREFTGQEQIPDVGLVNMNGRVYDPALGRFLSPDPNVQVVSDLQSYNRYSYASNNPLRYTDPTGYFWSELAGQFSGFGSCFASTFGNPITDIELIAGVAACLTPGPQCFALTLGFAALNAAATIPSGDGFALTVLNTAIGFGIGFATDGLAQNLGIDPITGLLLGSASAAVTTMISNGLTGQSIFGANVLGAVMITAVSGAVTLSTKPAPVSQASATASGSGGSGEQQLEGTLIACNGDCKVVPGGSGQGGDATDQFLAAQGNTGDQTSVHDFLNSLTRERIAALAQAVADGDSSIYDTNGYYNDLAQCGAYKCNLFVRDTLNAAGANTPKYTADEWGTDTTNIRNWRVVTDGSVEPGDVLGYYREGDHGHVGIEQPTDFGPDATLAATKGGVKTTAFFFNHDGVVEWRWTGN